MQISVQYRLYFIKNSKPIILKEFIMSATTNRPFDTAQEKILSSFLFNCYQLTDLQGDLVSITGDANTDKEKQKLGIDLEYKGKNSVQNIDEKAQLTYINKTLPTFVFELSSLQKGRITEGWFVLDTPRNLTHYYFLVTSIFLNDEATKKQLAAMSVHAEDINYYLTNYENELLRKQEYVTIVKAPKPKPKSKFNYKFELESEKDIKSCLVTKVNKQALRKLLNFCKIDFVSDSFKYFNEDISGGFLCNATCKELAKKLRAYVETNQINYRISIALTKFINIQYTPPARGGKNNSVVILQEQPINLVIKLEYILENISLSAQRRFWTHNGLIQTKYTKQPKKCE